jgi:hypothetical protein
VAKLLVERRCSASTPTRAVNFFARSAAMSRAAIRSLNSLSVLSANNSTARSLVPAFRKATISRPPMVVAFKSSILRTRLADGETSI